MILHQRKANSQREMAPIKLKFWPNYAGQGGEAQLIFQDQLGNWFWLAFEDGEEVKELLSQTHIVYHNFS